MINFRTLKIVSQLLPIAKFRTNRSGNVAMIFALAFIPVVLGVGVAIDYARAARLKTSLQAAADSAVLNIANSPAGTQASRQTVAANFVSANFVYKNEVMALNTAESEPTTSQFQVNLSAQVNNIFLRIFNNPTTTIHAFAEATTAGGAPLELALALDNTGSMSTDISAVISASNTLVDQVFASDPSHAKVKISVVPYVAAVNPGAQHFPSSMIDTQAQSIWAGASLRYRWVAEGTGCTPNPASGGGGGGPYTGPGGSGSGDRQGSLDVLAPVSLIAQELFGFGAAKAADVTPNTLAPLTYVPDPGGTGIQVPVGFPVQAAPAVWNDSRCTVLSNPAVSPYELFKRIPAPGGGTVQWKGCVMARPTKEDMIASSAFNPRDLDISEEAPNSADPNSLFVPYFWPDESDYYNNSLTTPGAWPPPEGFGYHNNYMADGAPPKGFKYGATWGGNFVDDDNMHSVELFKYDGVTVPAKIKETAPDSYGPNANCPDELLRLSNVKAAVKTKLNGMNYWNGGGTMISEGLSWAWRTLSPNGPYADGGPYATTTKGIVLMTDGINGVAANNTGYAPYSDFSAYDYLDVGRAGPLTSTWAPVITFDQMASFLDVRTQKSCDAIKATGVKIYAVLFSHGGQLSADQQARSMNLLKNCATKPDYAYLATNAASLTSAFSAIAGQIAPPRLTK